VSLSPFVCYVQLPSLDGKLTAETGGSDFNAKLHIPAAALKRVEITIFADSNQSRYEELRRRFGNAK
jgi:hypothetical protein